MQAKVDIFNISDVDSNPAVALGGKISVVLGVLFNVMNWFIAGITINQILTIIISILGVVYLVLKIYNGVLDMKRKKIELRKLKEDE